MILLYNPPSSANRKPILPMSLLALGALLEDKHDYHIIDGNLEDDPLEALRSAIDTHDVNILGVTVMPGPQLANADPICRQLKAVYPDLTIIWGGYFPTQHYDIVLKADYVDYVVRGHGEETFVALLDHLAAGRVPLALPGLAYHEANGKIIAGAPAPIPHPEKLPDFPYHRVDTSRYIRRTFMGERTLPHHSSYGCPFFCNFCAVVNMVGGRWLAQSAERTAHTVRHLVETYNADAVEFYDNNFFTSEKRIAAFCEQITDLDITWWGEGRIDTMIGYSDETWRLMRDSGLKMVFLGAESGSDETLKRMDKGGRASTQKTLEIAAKMAHYDIVPEMSFVVGNPPDPETDVEQTIRFIREVKQVNPYTEIIIYMYTPVPLSGELYEQAKADGFAFPETLDEWLGPDWQDFVQRRSAHMPWMNDPVRKRVRNFERVLNAYYPTVTDVNLDGVWRRVLKAASALRYHTGVYSFPLELRAMQKFIRYQRPETSGF
jgi:anaerobic magnesium-protoporphyrin IX monomethyl ester cyclase